MLYAAPVGDGSAAPSSRHHQVLLLQLPALLRPGRVRGAKQRNAVSRSCLPRSRPAAPPPAPHTRPRPRLGLPAVRGRYPPQEGGHHAELWGPAGAQQAARARPHQGSAGPSQYLVPSQPLHCHGGGNYCLILISFSYTAVMKDRVMVTEKNTFSVDTLQGLTPRIRDLWLHIASLSVGYIFGSLFF